METQVSSAFFGVVAFLSVAGNIFLCVLLLRRKSMLKKTYNILILNLATTDIFGGKFDPWILFIIIFIYDNS